MALAAGLYEDLFPNLLAGQRGIGSGMELPLAAPRILGNPMGGLATLAGQELPQVGRRIFGNPQATPAPGGDLTGIAADVATGPQPTRAGQFSPYDEVFARHAGQLAGDSQFLAVVAAGAKAESGFNPRAVGDNGKSVGLFQMHQAGAGAGLGDQRYDPEVQARVMVPRYAAAYQKYKAQGLTGPQLAAWTAAEAERPLGWDNPNSAAHQNYRNAYMTVTQATTPGAPRESAAPAPTGGSVGGSWDRAAGDLVPNQFGDATLSASEAAAACGPAAAVAFARATGRNPTLREATNIAKTTGWTEAGGMNGIANQARLLTTMGVPHRVTPQVNWGEVSASAQGGSPVTISTPAHYFVIDDFNPQTGQYHVGPSGTAFRAGARWMTAPQIQQLGRGTNGAIYLGAQE